MTSNILIVITGLVMVASVYPAPLSVQQTSKSSSLELSPSLVEGDMKFPLQGKGVLKRGTSVRWPNGIVPYEFTSTYGAVEQATVVRAMRQMEALLSVNNRQCVLFRPKVSSDQYYIVIENGAGCWSYVGQNTGLSMVRTVSLQYPGCLSAGTIMHEFLHTLGFYHEQSRPDRDSYIQVNYANIISGMESNFEKYGNTVVDTQNTPYDYGSVMHYPRTAFSSNGQPTIVPLQTNAVIGQRDTLSAIDIQEVRMFYGCNGTGVTLPPTTTVPTITATIPTSLATNSPSFVRPGASGTYFYALVRVIVPTNGIYTCQSSSTLDTFGILYNTSFTASSPSNNLLASDDDSAGNAQFSVAAALQSTITYYLVVTTYSPSATGDIRVTVIGPAAASLTLVSILATTTVPTTARSTSASTTTRPTSPLTTTPATTRPTSPSTTTPTTTRPTSPSTTTPTRSSYSHQLSTASPKFLRPHGSGTAANYDYQAIRITVTTTGSYIFVSSSSIDTYGVIYTSAFSAAQPTANLLTQDDDGAGGLQFRLIITLTAGVQYVLVVTTYSVNVIGAFTVIGTGPGQVTYTRLTN